MLPNKQIIFSIACLIFLNLLFFFDQAILILARLNVISKFNSDTFHQIIQGNSLKEKSINPTNYTYIIKPGKIINYF